MKKSYLIIALIVVVAIVGYLTVSGGKNAALPDLSALDKITVVAREEGSGTKEAFKVLVGTSEKGVNKIAASTAQAVEITASDKNAIGYAALNALEGANVKALVIDGVAATRENVGNRKYPLCREYLIAYKGELSELEVDLLAYIHGAGQKIAAEHATPIAKVTSFLSNKAEGSIKISGSSSAAPLVEELVRDYAKYNPNAKITVEVSDSTAGINSALRGDCDLAMSSRPLKEYEAELLETQAIASDAIAVIVNAESPLTELSTKQVKTIYDGSVESWKDLK